MCGPLYLTTTWVSRDARSKHHVHTQPSISARPAIAITDHSHPALWSHSHELALNSQRAIPLLFSSGPVAQAASSGSQRGLTHAALRTLAEVCCPVDRPPACAARAARSSRRRTQRCSCVAAVASPVVCSCGRLASRTGRRRWRARREALSPTRHVGQPQLSSGLRRERPSAAPAPSLGPALHLLTWRSASVLGRAPQARQSPP